MHSQVHNNTALEIEHQPTVSDVETSYPKLPVSAYAKTKLLFANGSLFGIGSNGITLRVFQMKLAETEMNWKEVASLVDSRSSFSAAAFHSDSFVIAGGFRNSARTNSVALYDMHINKWKSISCLNHSRSSHSLVSCHKTVYALGGYDDAKYLSSVERLRFEDEKWELVAPMQTPRFGFEAVSCGDYIYAIGGFFLNKQLNDVEKYNSNQKKWSPVASMIFKRYWHSACVWQGKIIVVGGLNHVKQEVAEIECYDPADNTWSVVGTRSRIPSLQRHRVCKDISLFWCRRLIPKFRN